MRVSEENEGEFETKRKKKIKVSNSLQIKRLNLIEVLIWNEVCVLIERDDLSINNVYFLC